MNEEKIVEAAVNSSLGTFFGEYSWIFVVGFLVLLFKSTIESSVAGLMVFLGSDYDDDDVVYLNNRPARIIRVGLWSTVFYVYHIKEDENGKKIITGGNKILVDNTKLKDMMIEKPLQKIDLL